MTEPAIQRTGDPDPDEHFAYGSDVVSGVSCPSKAAVGGVRTHYARAAVYYDTLVRKRLFERMGGDYDALPTDLGCADQALKHDWGMEKGTVDAELARECWLEAVEKFSGSGAIRLHSAGEAVAEELGWQ